MNKLYFLIIFFFWNFSFCQKFEINIQNPDLKSLPFTLSIYRGDKLVFEKESDVNNKIIIDKKDWQKYKSFRVKISLVDHLDDLFYEKNLYDQICMPKGQSIEYRDACGKEYNFIKDIIAFNDSKTFYVAKIKVAWNPSNDIKIKG